MDFNAIKAYIENTYQNSSIINKIENLNKINDHITIGEQPTKKQHLTLYDLIQLDNLISDTVKKQISQRIRALGGKSFKEIQRIKNAYEKIQNEWLKNKITGSIIFDYMSYEVVQLESLKKIMNYETIHRQFYDIINEQHVLKTEKKNIWFAGSVFEYAVRYSDAEIVKYFFDNVKNQEQKYQLLSKIAEGGGHADAIIESHEKNKKQDNELSVSFYDCLGLTAFQIAVHYERYILIEYFLDKVTTKQGYELIAQKCRQKKAKQQYEINTIHVAAFSVFKNTKTLKILIDYLNNPDHFNKKQINDVINVVMTDGGGDKNTTTGALVTDLKKLTKLNKTLTDDYSRKELYNKIQLIKESIEILKKAGGLTLTVKPPPPPPKKKAEWSNVCIKF